MRLRVTCRYTWPAQVAHHRWPGPQHSPTGGAASSSQLGGARGCPPRYKGTQPRRNKTQWYTNTTRYTTTYWYAKYSPDHHHSWPSGQCASLPGGPWRPGGTSIYQHMQHSRRCTSGTARRLAAGDSNIHSGCCGPPKHPHTCRPAAAQFLLSHPSGFAPLTGMQARPLLHKDPYAANRSSLTTLPRRPRLCPSPARSCPSMQARPRMCGWLQSC
jgi:hypothetical protein